MFCFTASWCLLQLDAPAEGGFGIPARSAHPESDVTGQEAGGHQASPPPPLQQQQWNGLQSEVAAAHSLTHSLGAPASSQPSNGYGAGGYGGRHSAGYHQGQEGFGPPDGSTRQWRMPAQQNQEGFGTPDTSASQWEQQQEGGFGAPLGPTPQQKMPAEQQQGGGTRRQPAPAFEWEPIAEHQAEWQQQERRQPDGGARDGGRLHTPQAQGHTPQAGGWGQPGPPHQQQRLPPQALKATKPRPGGQRERQNHAEQRERSIQAHLPSTRHGGAWDAGSQPSMGHLSGKSLPSAAHSVHGLRFLGQRQVFCIAPRNSTPVHATAWLRSPGMPLWPNRSSQC